MGIIPEQLEQTVPEPAADEEMATQAADEETATQASDEELVLEDLLVEDVSIDGMCGVY